MWCTADGGEAFNQELLFFNMWSYILLQCVDPSACHQISLKKQFELTSI